MAARTASRGEFLLAVHGWLTIDETPGGAEFLEQLSLLANAAPDRFERLVNGPRGLLARVEREIEKAGTNAKAVAPEPGTPARVYPFARPASRGEVEP
jgi:hypothetical protein